jgi:hypothetical protein
MIEFKISLVRVFKLALLGEAPLIAVFRPESGRLRVAINYERQQLSEPKSESVHLSTGSG